MNAFDGFPNIPEVDKKDIVELEENIDKFKSGEMDEERFKLYRLTRGVYGQRQFGVHMFRIKIPYGKITPKQIKEVARLAAKYASSNLHLTTRQDIQLHFVKLSDAPHVWRGLTNVGLTGREACGNTVRNLTASPTAGIDPEEPFDITPYAHVTAYYFLRNPVCQEMGRKIKPSFSSSEKDTAFSYFHDFGFIPKIQNGKRGFKVVVGGGLGAVSIEAKTAYEFLETDQIVPFMEAGLRVFDRYGERQSRQKARMKFLVKSLGIEKFLELIEEERAALPYKTYPIEALEETPHIPEIQDTEEPLANFDDWKKSNVFEQKQKGYYGVYVRVPLGDISSENALVLADILEKYVSEDVRVTVNQGLLLRHVPEQNLSGLHRALSDIGLGKAGFDSLADVTACPGTDTCNLAVTNSTGLAGVIEDFVEDEFPELLFEQNLKIKISGCMNACGQHMAANIGFHGSSIKRDDNVIPAMQIVLGGGLDPAGKGWIAHKIIKVPTKRIIDTIRETLKDYFANREGGEWFNDYVDRKGKRYFYDILKEYANVDDLKDEELLDWGQDHLYQQEIGVGECAGVILDVIGSILKDAQEKLDKAKEELENGAYAASIYYSYAAFVVAAKAALLSEDIQCNTQIKIIEDFEEHLSDKVKWAGHDGGFAEFVLRINQNEPEEAFAKRYLEDADKFFEDVLRFRKDATSENKEVIESYYKA